MSEFGIDDDHLHLICCIETYIDLGDSQREFNGIA